MPDFEAPKPNEWARRDHGHEDYVTLATAQTISGSKTFSTAVTFNAGLIIKSGQKLIFDGP